jgi:hypothetical protein
MILTTYLNSPGNSIYVTDDYLNLISNHRETILNNTTPTLLNEQEVNLYRHRIHAFLLDKHIPFHYHLAIMVLNNMETEFEFGIARNNILNNQITTIYIPDIDTLDLYAKKLINKAGI